MFILVQVELDIKVSLVGQVENWIDLLFVYVKFAVKIYEQRGLSGQDSNEIQRKL